MDGRIAGITLKRAWRSVADLVLPRVCVVCGRQLLLSEEHICTVCEAGLPRTFFSSLRDNPMARAFNALVDRELGWAQGESKAPCPELDAPSGARSVPATQPYGYATALLFYRGDSPYKNIPMGLKYGRGLGEGRHFARMLGRDLAASPLFADVDAVIPVPLHRARRWRRGYNQAEVVARGIAEGVSQGASGNGPLVFTGILKRVRRTKTQTRLHSGDRYANVKSAFVADARKLKAVSHILLVDDVFTTGATLLACERALRAGLAEVFGPDAASKVRISVATLSFVG